MAVVVLYGNFGLKKKYYLNQLYFHRKYIDLLSWKVTALAPACNTHPRITASIDSEMRTYTQKKYNN